MLKNKLCISARVMLEIEGELEPIPSMPHLQGACLLSFKPAELREIDALVARGHLRITKGPATSYARLSPAGKNYLAELKKNLAKS